MGWIVEVQFSVCSEWMSNRDEIRSPGHLRDLVWGKVLSMYLSNFSSLLSTHGVYSENNDRFTHKPVSQLSAMTWYDKKKSGQSWSFVILDYLIMTLYWHYWSQPLQTLRFLRNTEWMFPTTIQQTQWKKTNICIDHKWEWTSSLTKLLLTGIPTCLHCWQQFHVCNQGPVHTIDCVQFTQWDQSAALSTLALKLWGLTPMWDG